MQPMQLYPVQPSEAFLITYLLCMSTKMLNMYLTSIHASIVTTQQGSSLIWKRMWWKNIAAHIVTISDRLGFWSTMLGHMVLPRRGHSSVRTVTTRLAIHLLSRCISALTLEKKVLCVRSRTKASRKLHAQLRTYPLCGTIAGCSWKWYFLGEQFLRYQILFKRIYRTLIAMY